MTDKISLKKRLVNEIPELKSIGWPENELILLQKHFTFYIGLVNGDIKPSKPEHENFILNVKKWENAKPKTIHEKIYINYIKFSTQKNKNKKNLTEEHDVWKNIELNPVGMREYPSHMLEKFNTEYEEITYDEWYDDWKHS